jgi:hypothetical protein
LQKWAIFFYQQKSVDPETRKQVPIIGKLEIGLLYKRGSAIDAIGEQFQQTNCRSECASGDRR